MASTLSRVMPSRKDQVKEDWLPDCGSASKGTLISALE